MEAAQEIASILESQLPSAEKLMLLAVYMPDTTLPAQEINKCNTSTPVDDLQDQIQKEEANTKKLKDDDVISKLKDESLSRSSSQQSNLTWEDKSSSVLAAILSGEDIPLSKDNTATTSQEVKLPVNSDKIQHKEEANTKELKDDDVISNPKDESLSHSSSQQANAKRSVDPFIIETLSSILKSDLNWEDKSSSVLAAILSGEDITLSKDNTATTSQEVKLPVNSGKSQDSEEKAKGGDNNLLHDETSEKCDESLSLRSPQQEGKANVASVSELNLKEKSIYNGTEKDIPPPEDDTSSTSSKVELEEVDQLTDTRASIRVTPAESCRIMLEHEILKVKESCSNSGGEEDELTMDTQEAACKQCNVLMLQESRVLNAKCGCTTSSLIHEDCENVWSREKGNKCSYCEQEIQYTKVTLSLVPRQASVENPETPSSTSKGSWCCFKVFF